jgi:hypothetical protein
MKIVIDKNTKVAAFLFEDSASVVLAETQLEAPDLLVLDMGHNTHEVVSGDAPGLPLYWVPYALSYAEGQWAIADQELYDALLPQAEIAYQRLLETKGSAVRSERNQLLKDRVDAISPLRLEAMASEQQAAWRTYRQALLDVPQQPGFPLTIVWPVKPE